MASDPRIQRWRTDVLTALSELSLTNPQSEALRRARASLASIVAVASGDKVPQKTVADELFERVIDGE